MIRKARAITPALTIALIVFGGFLAVRLALDARTNQQIGREIARVQSEADELEQKNADLRLLTGRYSSEAFAEEQARTKLGLRQPGERTVVLERATTTNGASSPGTSKPRGESNARKWWRYFFR